LKSEVSSGECWAMSGSSGHLGLQLAHAMHITSITMEHISMETSENIQSAPRSLLLWGLSDTNGILHADFMDYDIYSSSRNQTVDTDTCFHGLRFNVVILEVLSNWGLLDFTCLYSVVLHGQA
ncbi:uncharacterized protein LAESUDRAFT_613908, partial [Laetiporus sulphureus 93-53]